MARSIVARVLAIVAPARRLARMARTARARTVRTYSHAAGFVPAVFLARSTRAPEGAYRLRFADGTLPPRADSYRLARPSPVVGSGVVRCARSGVYAGGDMLARCWPVPASAATVPAYVTGAGFGGGQ